jgi:hypothetical protein
MLELCLSLLSFTILCSCLLIIIVAHVLQCVNVQANYMHGRAGHTGLLRGLGWLSGGTHTPRRVLHTKAESQWHPFSCVLLLWSTMGQCRVKKHSSKIFKSEKHWVQVTFDLCTELGYCWAILLAAFFLIPGYFIIQVVFFRPWGLQNTKNAFYKKMLCDQASDRIISKSLPATRHS